MTRSRRIPGALALAVTLALTAAACGDDDGGGDAADTTAAPAADTTAAPAADTTGAPAADTTAAPEETEPPAAAAFQVPTDNCPPEATEPLADGEPVKIAFVGPQTGPLAAFGVIGQGMKVYFDKINEEEGGAAGHPIELVTKDDAYDPAKSGPAVQEALEGDQVFASVIQIGTPNVAGTRQLYADACVPQALVGTGFPNWGDPNNFPWTTGGIPSYTVESNVWTQFIQEKFPDATKVALLTFNNDFGKTYQTALNELLPAAGLEIVADIVHEPTSDLTNEVTQLLAAGPDVIIGGTTSTFCTTLMTLARQGGFTGPIINSYTCQAIEQFMVPAGEAAANVHTLVVLKDPADPNNAEDPGIQQYLADVETYGAGVDPNIGNVGTGYNIAYIAVDAINRAAEMEGGLTRANLMNAFWSVDLEPPLALGGVAKVDGVTDAYISEFGVMAEFDPAGPSYLISEGVEVDVEGEGGLFEG
jgi:ABC-type branched-subunit amino acid transport system substrate-binding protein